MELLILSHAPSRILEQGFVPAARELDLSVTILTDCIAEHLAQPALRAAGTVLECDVFNPLAVARLLAVRGGAFAGVLAADAAVRASAAVTAHYLGLPGPAWRSVLQSDQRSGAAALRRIVNCAEPAAVLGQEWFPATVQPLEGGLDSGGAIVRDAAQLQYALARLRHGYALVERYREDEEVFALECLGTPDGFVVLGGGRIEFSGDAVRAKRLQAIVPRPPRCDEVLAALDPGIGRHHVEYALGEDGPHIREMHNGLHDDAAEFALDARLGGELFRDTIRASLGLPLKLARRPRPAPMLEAAA